ncbi:hypothetical protein niasHT_038047 [Heterodera trifolii]|uniref:Uncharacterized protein n=1 Tax=Heterodera trifolii TaxID=157864 RepID=A0ABD2HS51_9BILA
MERAGGGEEEVRLRVAHPPIPKGRPRLGSIDRHRGGHSFIHSSPCLVGKYLWSNQFQKEERRRTRKEGIKSRVSRKKFKCQKGQKCPKWKQTEDKNCSFGIPLDCFVNEIQIKPKGLADI